ncbi:alpha/beta hydrolase [Oricola sp.]|uniref:alpha/beta hydrolase n=1 Tax=Oricola sp. TaxID=1979950 RepID=UPI003BAC78CF
MLGRMLADLVIKPGGAPLFDNPANYGLAYEGVEFKAQDGVTVRGWLVNPGQDKVIVQTHFGVQCCRAGYTVEGKGMLKGYPTDIKFLHQIKHLADAGYTVLAYDLRHHGESDPGTRKWIFDGQEEYKDVLAAVGFIIGHLDYKDAPIGLLSLCMGSSSTLLAYGIPGGLQEVANIKAVIFVQPNYDGVFLKNFGAPGFLVNAANRSSIARGGPDMFKSPLERVAHVNVPTLVTQNRNDPWFDNDYVNGVYEQLKTEKEFLWFDGQKNRLDGYGYFGEHPEKMLEWFNRYVITEQPVPRVVSA